MGSKEVDLAGLKLGDHIFVSGVPNYARKHPLNHMGGLHAVMVGHKGVDPLFGALGYQSAVPLSKIQDDLVCFYKHEPAVQDRGNVYRRYSDCLDLKNDTVEEAQAEGGCKTYNRTAVRIFSSCFGCVKRTQRE